MLKISHLTQPTEEVKQILKSEESELPFHSQFTWEATIKLSVDGIWVADGFDIDAEALQEELVSMLERRLGYANEGEVEAEVVKLSSPNKTLIKTMQGYKV